MTEGHTRKQPGKCHACPDACDIRAKAPACARTLDACGSHHGLHPWLGGRYPDDCYAGHLCQYLVQTAISSATFGAANSLFIPIGVPFAMGRPELIMPMLIGATLAMFLD